LVYRLGKKKRNEVNGGGKEAAHSNSVEASSSKVEQGKGSLLGMEATLSCSSLALKQRWGAASGPHRFDFPTIFKVHKNSFTLKLENP
jgi:hypothetical protein